MLFPFVSEIAVMWNRKKEYVWEVEKLYANAFDAVRLMVLLLSSCVHAVPSLDPRRYHEYGKLSVSAAVVKE